MEHHHVDRMLMLDDDDIFLLFLFLGIRLPEFGPGLDAAGASAGSACSSPMDPALLL